MEDNNYYDEDLHNEKLINKIFQELPDSEASEEITTFDFIWGRGIENEELNIATHGVEKWERLKAEIEFENANDPDWDIKLQEIQKENGINFENEEE